MSTSRPAAKKTAAHRLDDQPFDFNLDAAEPSRELKPFVFNWKQRRWEMKHLEELDVWGVVEAADGGEIAAVTGVFRLALDEQWQEFRKIHFPQWRFRALFRAYRQHCGYNVDGTPVDGDDGL